MRKTQSQAGHRAEFENRSEQLDAILQSAEGGCPCKTFEFRCSKTSDKSIKITSNVASATHIIISELPQQPRLIQPAAFVVPMRRCYRVFAIRGRRDDAWPVLGETGMAASKIKVEPYIKKPFAKQDQRGSDIERLAELLWPG